MARCGLSSRFSAANRRIALLLQSTRLVAAVAEPGLAYYTLCAISSQ